MKVLNVTLDIWKWQGCVLIGGTSQGFARWAKAQIDADIETGSNAAGHAHVAYGKPWLIWVESLKDVPALAHEALHVTAGILEGRGLKYSEASEEAYTYTMEFIIRQVLNPSSKWKKA